MSDEQTSGQPATKKVATQDMETPSDAWGQPISEERQAELQRYIDRRKGRHNSTQERPTLTGADVFASQSGLSAMRREECRTYPRASRPSWGTFRTGRASVWHTWRGPT